MNISWMCPATTSVNAGVAPVIGRPGMFWPADSAWNETSPWLMPLDRPQGAVVDGVRLLLGEAGELSSFTLHWQRRMDDERVVDGDQPGDRG